MDEEEYRALTRVLRLFYQYGDWARRTFVAPRQARIEHLTPHERLLVPYLQPHLQLLAQCIDANEAFTKNLALTTAQDWGVALQPAAWGLCSYQDYDKVRLVLLQMVREWSTDGAAERQASIDRIVMCLELRFPDVEARQHIRVLVPGAGLGRLVVDLVLRGFRTQGNEFSYHMLLALSYILNHLDKNAPAAIHPFVHKFSHTKSRSHQVRTVSVPDYFPQDMQELTQKYPGIPLDELMDMSCGLFVDLYGPAAVARAQESYTDAPDAGEFRDSNKELWDVLTTCFFLDTASNILDYLRTIHHCLKQGGVWVNVGPLLWHWEEHLDEGGDPSSFPKQGLELSRDDLWELVQLMGFEVVEHSSGDPSTYDADPEALGGWVYQCEFWVVVKK